MNNLVPVVRVFARLGLAFSAQRRSRPTHALIFLPGLSMVLVLSALLLPLAASLLGKHQAHANTGFSIDNYICGSEVQRPSPPDNFWDDVFGPNAGTDPNHWVYNSFDGTWVQAIGWQGGSGPYAKNAPCSGDYWYGWDQYYHEAQWQFDDFGGNDFAPTAQQGTLCKVQVFVPPWFFGAQQAQYSLEITGDASQQPQPVQFAPF